MFNILKICVNVTVILDLKDSILFVFSILVEKLAHSKVIVAVQKFDQVKLFAKLFGTTYCKDNFSDKLWFCFLKNQIHGVLTEHVLNRYQSYDYYKTVTCSYMVFWWSFITILGLQTTLLLSGPKNHSTQGFSIIISQIRKKNPDAYWFESNAYFRSLEHILGLQTMMYTAFVWTQKPLNSRFYCNNKPN